MSGKGIGPGDLVMVVNTDGDPCLGAWAGTTYTAGERIVDKGRTGWTSAEQESFWATHCLRCCGRQFHGFAETHLVKLAGPAPSEQLPATEPVEALA